MAMLSEPAPDQTRSPGGRGNKFWERSPLAGDFVKVAIAALIPLVLFAVLAIVNENRRAREEIENDVLTASRRLAEALDNNLGQQLRTLSALAFSTDLDPPPRLTDFNEEVTRVTTQHRGWLAMSL